MTLTYVDGEEWCGIYINNVLIYENHSISIINFIDILIV
jgi:hypothetical protein